MSDTKNDFKWSWENFILYGLIWLVLSLAYDVIKAKPILLSRDDIECVYSSLIDNITLTEEQEYLIAQKCGQDPCEKFSGCALDENNPHACDGFEECHQSAAGRKYTDCYIEHQDLLLPMSTFVYMPKEQLTKYLKACVEQSE